MGTDLSKLSPQSRKTLIASRSDEQVRALVELAPGASPDTLDPCVEALGGVVRSWSAASHTMTLSVPSGRLAELAGDRAVVYVETGAMLSVPEEDEGSGEQPIGGSGVRPTPHPDDSGQ